MYSEGNFNIELYNNYTGEVIKSDNKYIPKDKLDFYFLYFEPKELKAGTYGVSSKLENLTTKEIRTSRSTFEVKIGNSGTEEISLLEKARMEAEKERIEKEKLKVDRKSVV